MPEKDEKRVVAHQEPVYDYAEMILAGPRFNVSNETIVGALHAAGLQRKKHLSVSEVEEALKAFATREVQG